MMPLERQVLKDWHESVTEDMRVKQIEKLVMAIQNPYSISEQSNTMQQDIIITNAKMAEKEMFEIANSRSEYYYMLAVKIYNLQRDTEQEVMQTEASSSQTSSSLHLLNLTGFLANEERKSDITNELRHRHTVKLQEDLRPSPHSDIPLEVARKAESICFERANSLNEYHKYTSDVSRVKQGLKLAGDIAGNTSCQPSQDEIETKFAHVVENIWQGETPDEEFNKEMLTLLIAIDKHSLEG